jgi:hypothetical protein
MRRLGGAHVGKSETPEGKMNSGVPTTLTRLRVCARNGVQGRKVALAALASTPRWTAKRRIGSNVVACG